MTTKNLETQLTILAKKLGFGAVTSYAKLWKTSINTFGHKTASMWFFTISINVDDQIVGIEVNSTYFKHTPQTIKINQLATFDAPISFETAIKLIS